MTQYKHTNVGENTVKVFDSYGKMYLLGKGETVTIDGMHLGSNLKVEQIRTKNSKKKETVIIEGENNYMESDE